MQQRTQLDMAKESERKLSVVLTKIVSLSCIACNIRSIFIFGHLLKSSVRSLGIFLNELCEMGVEARHEHMHMFIGAASPVQTPLYASRLGAGPVPWEQTHAGDEAEAWA